MDAVMAVGVERRRTPGVLNEPDAASESSRKSNTSFSIEPPLVIDLDGTLLRSDLLLETSLHYLRVNPLKFLRPLLWLTKGKAWLKGELARTTNVDVSVLPYDHEVLTLIESERRRGRKVVLATASPQILAERVAEHLGLFDEVLGSDQARNLSADCKREALVAKFGECGYDYAGNSPDDVPVWLSARRAIVVNPVRGVENRSRGLDNVAAVIHSNRSSLRQWVTALRLHQWVKNLLLFVPLLASHRITDLALLGLGVLAFLLFGLCASGVYVLNDLLDLEDDRHHPTKRNRPFASGRLSIKSGLIAFPILLLSAFAGSRWLLPPAFSGLLAAYVLLTLAYSLVLKRIMTVDVILLAMLYTVRIIVGAFAFGLHLTAWMLAFSMFLFLSLALVKRYTELRRSLSQGAIEPARGRGYCYGDLELIASLGSASGYLAVLVLALYVQDQATLGLYGHPQIIWLACPLLLFWITRIWMIAHRGLMHDDPVVFAVSDRISLLVGSLFFAAFWAAV